MSSETTLKQIVKSFLPDACKVNYHVTKYMLGDIIIIGTIRSFE